MAGVRAAALTEAAEVAASRGGCPCNTAETIAHLLRCLAAEAHDGDTQAVPVCVCGHPMHQHHEDVCLTDCGCNDGREPEEPTDLPGRLAAALTARFTELGNPFSQMRYHEQGPDGWPASHPVGPNRVADVLRELMPAASAVPLVGSAEPDSDETGPRTVCICGHTRAEHIAVSGRLLCDACDPDSTENLVCRGFDAL
ncbi:hypothetical protein PYK79_48380 [Streptomyces sp. ID05-04B]|uniref:hypothetical protein n=1 Tax=Streptomyces sp. ID05-04B TaxID=3028661 RepID=UPI0029C51D17|nr:hypothetical protein [Streptomyces sp. ID05-04B]MDX5569521.1 hypothetical protein [Streptomyces sp. ID05-04B]